MFFSRDEYNDVVYSGLMFVCADDDDLMFGSPWPITPESDLFAYNNYIDPGSGVYLFSC